jgi:hypothetical protein
MTEVDIAAYCYPETEIPAKRSKRTGYRVKHDQRFICVPESWAIRAFEVAKQRQTAGPLITGLVLWQKYHMERGKQPVKLTNNMLSRFGIQRRSVTRWLHMLESAGLISVWRFKHRSPLITITLEGKQ